MPALPWITLSAPPDPAMECTVVAARLPLRSHRDMPRFIRWSLRIRRQLAGTPGLIGWAMAARVVGRTFWIVSAWTHRSELARFERTAPHHEAKQLLRGAMLPSTFVVWSCRADQLPVRWDEVHRRIAAASPQPTHRKGAPQ